MKFHIYQDARGEWRWRLKARNGRIVADSGEGYVTRGNALRAARRLTGDCHEAYAAAGWGRLENVA